MAAAEVAWNGDGCGEWCRGAGMSGVCEGRGGCVCGWLLVGCGRVRIAPKPHDELCELLLALRGDRLAERLVLG